MSVDGSKKCKKNEKADVTRGYCNRQAGDLMKLKCELDNNHAAVVRANRPLHLDRREWWGAMAIISLCLMSGCAHGGSPRLTSPGEWAETDSKDLSQFEDRKAIDAITGRATYYSDSLAGNRTANGEVYDPAEFTAANRDLPFGTIVRVVREDNNSSVIVRVNDRGPFGDSERILDVSKSAARKLDMLGVGVVDVRVEILAYGKKKRRK
jgi:rare lipoprotein A